MLNWVRLNRYCEMSGDTPDAVNCRLRNGHWIRGVHTKVPEGSASIWVNLKAVEDWAEGLLPPHQHGKKR